MNTLSQRHVPFEASGRELIEGQACVVAVDGAMVWLATLAPAACGSCATNAACGTAAQQAPTTPATPSMQWRVPRSLPAGGTPLALGDTVRVGGDARKPRRGRVRGEVAGTSTMQTRISANTFWRARRLAETWRRVPSSCANIDTRSSSRSHRSDCQAGSIARPLRRACAHPIGSGHPPAALLSARLAHAAPRTRSSAG